MSDTLTGVPCPYVGLAPFRESDREFFFGREREQRIITANLLSSPLTILYGPSGVGKSSLLMAGVVPYIRREHPRTPVLLFRDWAAPDLNAALARACMAAIGRAEDDFEAPPGGLPFDERLRLCAQAAGDTVLVIFDQFEEFFQHHPKSTDPASFEAQLARAVNREEVDADFLFALREDSLARLDRLRERIPNLLSNRLPLKHLDYAGAEEAIRRPLAAWNDRYGGGKTTVGVEDDLVAALIREVRTGRIKIDEASGSGRTTAEEAAVEAPFLQLVLTRLWEEELRPAPGDAGEGVGGLLAGCRVLRADTLSRLGGAQAIVRGHVADAMDSLDGPSREVCARFFDRLVTPSGQKIAYCGNDLAAYCRQAETASPAADKALTDRVLKVLERLCDEHHRILRSSSKSAEPMGETRYEIYHDVLAPAILSWRARYLAEQRQERERFRLAEQTRQAEARAREQEAVNRHLLRWRLALAVALFGTVLALVWALHQQGVAEQRRQQVMASSAIGASYSTQYNRRRPELGGRFAVQGLALAMSGGSSDLQGRAAAALRRALSYQLLWSHGQDTDAAGASFAADGPQTASRVAALLMTRDGRRVGVVRGDTVRFFDWRAPKGQEALGRPMAHDGVAVKAMVLSADGTRLLTGDDQGRVWQWDSGTGDPIKTARGMEHQGKKKAITTMAVSSADQLATGGDSGEVWLWDLQSGEGQPLPMRPGDRRRVSDLAFSPDGKLLAVGEVSRGETEVWELDRLHGSENRLLYVLDTLRAHPEGEQGGQDRMLVDAVAFSPDGRFLATGDRNNRTILWSAREGAPVLTLWGHTGQITGLAFSPDGTRLASTGSDYVLRLWETATGRPLLALSAHTAWIDDLAFSPDGTRLVTGARNGQVRLWDVACHAGPVTAVAFHPSGRLLATGGDDRLVKIWKLGGHDLSRELVATLRGHKGRITRLAFSPDGRSVASASFDKTVRVWSLSAEPGPHDEQSDARVLVYQDAVYQDDKFYDVAFSPDGKWLAAAGANHNAVIWDTVTWKPSFAGHHEGQVWGLAFSPRSDYLASAGGDGRVYLWRLPKGEQVACIVDPDDDKRWLRGVQFSADGRSLVIAAGTGGLMVLDELPGLDKPARAASRVVRDCLKAARLTAVPGIDSGNVLRARFTPDGGYALLRSREQLWNPGSSQSPRSYSVHRGRVNDFDLWYPSRVPRGRVEDLELVQDGGRIATAGQDGVFQVSPLNDGELLRLGCRRFPDPLTDTECKDEFAESCPPDPCQ